MTRSLLTAAAVLLAGIPPAHAQTFKVEKYDIKGDGGPTTSPPKPRPGACSYLVPTI